MLTFIKRTATSWQHDNGTLKSSFGGGIPITNDTDNTIIFQLPNGTNFPKEAVLITDCKIIDKTDGDAEYTFSTTTEFLDKLEELNYPFINTGGGGGAGTNLGYTPSASNGIVTSSTGTDATIPLANGTDAGLSENNVTDSEKSFLLTAGGLSLADYAKLDTSSLENYTTTTDMNTLLGAKADKSSWVDYSATSTINGWSAFTTKEVFIKQEDKGCWVKIKIEGTSTTGTTSCTLNFNADESKRSFTISRNAGTYGSGVVDTASGSNVLTFYNTVSGGAYTTSGTKLVDVTLFIKKA